MRRLFSILILLCAGSSFAQYADTSDVIRGILADAGRNFKEKRYTMVQYYCDKGLEIQPYNEDLLYLKADAFYWTDKYEDAVKFYDRIITVKGKLENKSRYGRAMAEYMLSRYSEAVADILKFQKKDTLWSSGYEVLFECYRLLRKADSASITLRQIEKSFPKNVKNSKYRAELFAVRHQYDSASKYYYMYDSLAEPDFYAYRDHARVLVKMEEFDKAQELLKKIFDAYPNQFQCQLIKGECLLHDNKLEELKSLVSYLYGISPDDPGIFLLLAKANFSALENNEEALKQLEECFKRGGDKNPEAWYVRGCVKAEQKFYADAQKDLEEAVKIDPYYTEALCKSGDCFFFSRLYDDALNCYGRALKMNPLSAESYEARGYYYMRMNKIGKAKADFEKAVSLKPLTPQFYADVAITDVFDKNYTKALDKINHALQLVLQKNDSMVYKNILLFKWTILMLDLKTDSALQCVNALKPGNTQEALAVNYMKFMTYFLSKKYAEVEKVFESMDTAYVYHMPEYVNVKQLIYERENEPDKWVKIAHDFFVGNATNYYLLDNVILLSEESSKNLLRQEQIDLGDDLVLFKNIDSTMQVSLSVATKPNKEREKKIIGELDRQISKSKDPEVLYLIKARYLEFMGDAAAINAFNKAIELNPDYKTAYYFRGKYKKKKLKDEKGGEEDLARSK